MFLPKLFVCVEGFIATDCRLPTADCRLTGMCHKNREFLFTQKLDIMRATIAQWIRLGLQSCGSVFESQVGTPSAPFCTIFGIVLRKG